MEAQVWYTINLGTEPANYHIGDFNCALFTVTEMGYVPVQWAA